MRRRLVPARSRLGLHGGEAAGENLGFRRALVQLRPHARQFGLDQNPLPRLLLGLDGPRVALGPKVLGLGAGGIALAAQRLGLGRCLCPGG